MIKIGKMENRLFWRFMVREIKIERRRCPAVIFATNRTESVIGRIIKLTISIIIIKGINTAGVPCGKRVFNSVRGDFTSLMMMGRDQNNNPMGKTTDKCALTEKTEGKSEPIL
jgi:hypothetical protein